VTELNHASSPFGTVYFGDKVLLFAEARLEGFPSILGFLPLLR
jgi:hypothetical protein